MGFHWRADQVHDDIKSVLGYRLRRIAFARAHADDLGGNPSRRRIFSILFSDRQRKAELRGIKDLLTELGTEALRLRVPDLIVQEMETVIMEEKVRSAVDGMEPPSGGITFDVDASEHYQTVWSCQRAGDRLDGLPPPDVRGIARAVSNLVFVEPLISNGCGIPLGGNAFELEHLERCVIEE